MWCGESYKSLAELTGHMRETRHYTKVISQEQISSWRSEGEAAAATAAAAAEGQEEDQTAKENREEVGQEGMKVESVEVRMKTRCTHHNFLLWELLLFCNSPPR